MAAPGYAGARPAVMAAPAPAAETPDAPAGDQRAFDRAHSGPFDGRDTASVVTIEDTTK